MKYFKVKETNEHFFGTSSGWSSFCGGGIVILVPVSEEEYEETSRIRCAARQRAEHQCEVRNYGTLADTIFASWCGHSSFYLANGYTASILKQGGYWKAEYVLKSYDVGDEQYGLFIQKSAIQEESRENMRQFRAKSPVKTSYDSMAERTISNLRPSVQQATQKAIANMKVSRDFVIELKELPKLRKDSGVTYKEKSNCWGRGTGSNGSSPRESTTGKSSMIMGTKLSYGAGQYPEDEDVAVGGGHRIDLMTYLNFASIAMGIRTKDWNGVSYTQHYTAAVTPTLLGITGFKKLLPATLENLAHAIRTQSACHCDTHIKDTIGNKAKDSFTTSTLWLVDNMDKNMHSSSTSAFSTGTAINLMLSENLKGNFSYELCDGSSIYYHVVDCMAGNPNRTGRPIFVAIVSLKPITEDVVKKVTKKRAA